MQHQERKENNSLMTYRLSQRAQDDLIAISEYTQEHYGVEQEILYLEKFENKLEYVGSNPLGVGAPCSHILPGLKSHLAEHHIIYFTSSADGVAYIVAILSGRMSSEISVDRHIVL